MRMIDIILKKKRGFALSKDEIAFFVDGLVAGEIPDYQASALLMAICFAGMTKQETAELTLRMTYSGETVDLSAVSGIKVDKHSTGGVGDTTTLIVAPLVAACGVRVAKMSGRGLGHTGGTLDKLESIPGIKIERTVNEFIDLVNKHGIAVVGQSENLVPADKLLYALRDVTGTVESIPLIASSIMSKKLAAGSDAIVLDVKTGRGAFMATTADAFELAKQMCDIGAILGRQTVAIVTDMNQPLGTAVGNALEVQEAIFALSNRLPMDDPLIQVSLLLGAYMLILADAAKDIGQAKDMLIHALEGGKAKEKLREMIVAMGGKPDCVDDPDHFVTADYITEIKAPKAGYICNINAMDIGRAAQILGAGRATKADKIDYNVGFVLKKRVGDPVAAGETIGVAYANDTAKFEQARKIFEGAITYSDQYCAAAPMIHGIVTKEGIEKYD